MLKTHFPLGKTSDIAGDHAIATVAELGGQPFRLADGRIVPVNLGAAPTTYKDLRPDYPVVNPLAAWDTNNSTAATQIVHAAGGITWYLTSNIIRKMKVIASADSGEMNASLTNVGSFIIPKYQTETFNIERRQVTLVAQTSLTWNETSVSRGKINEIYYWVQAGTFTNPAIKVGDIIDIDFVHAEVPLPAYIVQQITPHWILAPLTGAPMVFKEGESKPSPEVSFATINTAYSELIAEINKLKAGGYKVVSDQLPDYTNEVWQIWIQQTNTNLIIFERLNASESVQTLSVELKAPVIV
jgi:hypothetical protein